MAGARRLSGDQCEGWIFSAAECHAHHRTLLETRAAEIDPWVVVRTQPGAKQSAADYIELLATRRAWIGGSEARLRAFDALIAPTVPVVAPRIKPIMAMADARVLGIARAAKARLHIG